MSAFLSINTFSIPRTTGSVWKSHRGPCLYWPPRPLVLATWTCCIALKCADWLKWTHSRDLREISVLWCPSVIFLMQEVPPPPLTHTDHLMFLFYLVHYWCQKHWHFMAGCPEYLKGFCISLLPSANNSLASIDPLCLCTVDLSLDQTSMQLLPNSSC